MHNRTQFAFTLGRNDPIKPDLLHGWSEQEASFTWMIDAESAVTLPESQLPYGAYLELTVVPFVNDKFLPAQRLSVAVNDARIAECSVARPSMLAFYVPAHVFKEDAIRVTFEHPDAVRPVDVGSSGDGRKLAFAVRALRLLALDEPKPEAASRRSADWLDISQDSNSTTAMATAERAVGMPIAALLGQFASVGDNCEFGIFQRKCGAEPLGLLRFSTARLTPLIQGIDNGFEGLAEPGDVVPQVARGAWSEWMIHEKRYELDYHTEIREEDATAEQVLGQENAKLRFLRRTFIEDLKDGRKIYVCKRSDPLLTLDEVMPLFLALNRHAANRLLWVVAADEAHPAGTVVEVLPGLMRGHIERFAPPENVPSLSVPGWLAVCVNAWQLSGRRLWGRHDRQ